jgi:hypothetical protein
LLVLDIAMARHLDAPGKQHLRTVASEW